MLVGFLVALSNLSFSGLSHSGMMAMSGLYLRMSGAFFLKTILQFQVIIFIAAVNSRENVQANVLNLFV
jgi:hypothetical protein